MVMPACTEDVSQIIKTIVANNCSFGIRSGGHGVFAYSNSVDEGITIDFGETILQNEIHRPPIHI